jgi:aryl-alcohol dehydrogenase-like predicted oxidoreductase
MRTLPLGNSTLTTSALGLGCMGMSDFYGIPDETEALATLERAVELGISHFDTADVYGIGSNERLVGRGLAPWRSQVLIATKCGLLRDPDGSWKGVSGHPDHVRRSCDASLARLGVDIIDLYYLHRVDPEVPIEDTVGAMAQLVEAGKIRALGLSEAGPATLRRAHAVHPIAALQSEYSLWTRDLEADILPLCAELGITFVPYAPLGRGMLTATVTDRAAMPDSDYRHKTPRFEAENFDANRALAGRLAAMAAARRASAAQLALAWVLTAPQRVPGLSLVPIPGTKRRRWLEENVAALDVILTPDDLVGLDDLFPPTGVASGTRYPAFRMGELGR